MLPHFSHMGAAAPDESRAALADQGRRFWAGLATYGLSEYESLLCFDERLELKSLPGKEWMLRPTSLAARPLCDFVTSLAPAELRVHSRQEPRTHAEALKHVRRQWGVDLRTSRVRVGFTRGHLLDAVVLVPLDVDSDEETLQVAVEEFLEHRLGDEKLDLWVNSVGVARIARTRGLIVAADPHGQAESFPLQEVENLVQRGIEGLLDVLPESLLHPAEEAWTALEIPPTSEGLQADRCFASTCCPEALKAALEGMPFDSRRFTRGQERFLWASWEAASHQEQRDPVRTRAERLTAGELFAGRVRLAGSGFGLKRDYLDLWLLPDEGLLSELGERLSEICGPVQLGFYDSIRGGELLEFPTNGGAKKVAP